MTDRKIEDKWPGNENQQDGKEEWHRRPARGLHLQQIVEPDNEEVYNGVGTLLRAERHRRQLSLDEIASSLRIQQTHLLALEEGRTDDLPGPTYAIGFLRTYSEYFDLDSDEIIRQFKREATLVPVERRLVFPEPLDEARRPGLRTALVSLVVAGAVYGGWIFLERQGLLPTDVVAEPPERLAPYQAATDTGVSSSNNNANDRAENKAEIKAEDNVAAAAPTAEPVAPMINAGVDEPAARAAETKNAEAEITAPAVTSDKVTATTIEAAAIEATPVQPTQAADPVKDIETTDRTAIATTPGQGERAVAADVGDLANTTGTLSKMSETQTGVDVSEAPVSTKLATKIDITDSAGTPAVEARAAPAITAEAPAITAEEAAGAQPALLSPELGNPDTVPATSSVQAAIAPPPPAAPVAPVRSLTEGASADRTSPAPQATAPDGLGYRPQAYGAASSDVRVVLRARAESWVQVQGANNELLLTRMLRAGDSYHAPNRTDLVLMTGNAGAIEIIVDGEKLGPLGPIGLVRRNIPLNADHLRDQLQRSGRSNP